MSLLLTFRYFLLRFTDILVAFCSVWRWISCCFLLCVKMLFATCGDYRLNWCGWLSSTANTAFINREDGLKRSADCSRKRFRLKSATFPT